jgi:predicted Zn-dependent protease
MQFLSLYGFNAKAHQDGTSFVHLGERQFDGAVSIWDEAADPRTLGLLFDAEATPKQRVDLVAGGVSNALLYDRRTAAKAGTKSTGHSQGPIGAYPSNLFFGSGKQPVASLIRGVDRGLIVYDFWYTRILDPKTQVVTGLTRNGVFLIENGVIGPAVNNLRFTQSFAAALGPDRVLGVASDGRLVGGMDLPTVRLASWNFTGGANG